MAFVSGLLLIATATLLYTTQEKRIQSRLEDLWLQASQLGEKSQNRLVAVVASAATAVLTLVDRFFDSKLLSLPAFASALVTSFYSCTIAFAISAGWQLVTNLGNFALATLGTAVATVALWYRSARLPAALLVITCTGCYAVFNASLARKFIIAIYIGALTDLVIICIIRWALRRFLARKTVFAAILTLLLHGVILLLAILPLTLLQVRGPLSFMRRWHWLSEISIFWALTNTFVIIASSALILLLLLIFLHRLLWPVFEHLIYGLARFGIFDHRKALIALGVALICFSSPQAAKIVSALAKLLTP